MYENTILDWHYKNVARAQEALVSYKEGLVARESDPDFHEAKRLYEAGWRASDWNCIRVEGFVRVHVISPTGKKWVFFDYEDPPEEIYEKSGASDEALEFLSDLCEEAGLWGQYELPEWLNE